MVLPPKLHDKPSYSAYNPYVVNYEIKMFIVSFVFIANLVGVFVGDNSLMFLREVSLPAERSGLVVLVNNTIVRGESLVWEGPRFFDVTCISLLYEQPETVIIGGEKKKTFSHPLFTTTQGYPAVTTRANIISNRGSFICSHSTHNQTLIVEKKFILPDWDSHVSVLIIIMTTMVCRYYGQQKEEDMGQREKFLSLVSKETTV
ncbi:unnamed protein product [Auanema sp. JU1783]|nr:unnamed protein product [Auanema sp. JU1783]